MNAENLDTLFAQIASAQALGFSPGRYSGGTTARILRACRQDGGDTATSRP